MTNNSLTCEIHDASAESVEEIIMAMLSELDGRQPYKRFDIRFEVIETQSELSREMAEELSFQELRQLVDVDAQNPTKQELIEVLDNE